MIKNIKYEFHRYVCPPKDGKTLYVFKYLNPRNGRMVAYLEATVTDNVIYLDDLFVMSYARRHHLASKMIEQAMGLRENQVIRLDCYPDNYPALALYRKFGFEIDGEFEDPAGCTLYHMIKR